MTEPTSFASHEEWSKWKGCTSKRSYATVVEANLDVLLLWKAGKHAETYECPFGCGKIHITTKGGPVDGADAERRDGHGRTGKPADKPGDRRGAG